MSRRGLPGVGAATAGPVERRFVAVAVAMLASAVWSGVAAPGVGAATDPVRYQPPVAAEVVDPFRPPAHHYGAGNRGIDYATEPGATVHAAAPGVVTFAGRVGAGLHAVVLHPDGVRTTYAFLDDVSVRRGARLARGDEVGRSGGRFHFGARVGERYVDPRLLFTGGRARARLVPDPADGEGRMGSVGRERRSLARLVRSLPGYARRTARAVPRVAVGVARRVPNAVAALASRDPLLRLWVLQAGALTSQAWALVEADMAAARRRHPCTPARRAPPAPGGRRIAVLVAGLNSTSGKAAVDDVDTVALGYAPGDVHRFSYRGGTVQHASYSAADTTGDLAAAGARLAHLLRALAARHPGVAVDVLAHSQGGLVARAALTMPGLPAQVATLVTLGTPHQGADLAAIAVDVAGRWDGAVFARLLAGPDGGGIHVDRPNMAQLAPGSAFLRRVAGRRFPPHVYAVSVAARGDAVVASHRSRLPGAANVVVTVGAAHQHGALPGSGAATREIALALARLPPTCRSPADVAVDAVSSRVIAAAQVGVAAELAYRGRW